MIVLDASVVVDMLLQDDPNVDGIWEELLGDPEGAAAPHLLDAEVAQVLRRYVLRGEISAHRADGALDDLAALPIVRHEHTVLLKRAFALRDNVTIYDALYLSLAEALDARLLTRDGALAALPGVRARVRVIP